MNEMDYLNRGKLNELQASVKSIPRDSQAHTTAAEPVSEEVNQLLAQQHRGMCLCLIGANSQLTRCFGCIKMKLDNLY